MSFLSNPASYAAAVIPADATTFSPGTCRGLFVGGAGDLSVRMASDGATVVFTGVLAGSLLPLTVKGVNTATTATNIVRVW